MGVYNFKRDCRNIYKHMRSPKQRGGCMPYKTGHLARDATQGRFFGDTKFTVTINTQPNAHGAPYAVPLNTGAVPHNIPHAFGYGTIHPAKRNPYTGKFPFGVGGRFNGKFHPGSFKHYGFFDNADDPNSMLGYVFDYFKKHYGAKVLPEGYAMLYTDEGEYII